MKKIHRFLLPSDLAHQLRDVLKMEIEEEVDLIDGAGVEGRAKIVALQPNVEVELTNIQHSQAEPTIKVTLYAAILKRENFEMIVQKATEVGVSEIVPIITARTIKTGLKLDRLQKIAAEAAEQAGRAVVPIVHDAISFKQSLVDCARNDVNVISDPSGEAQWPRLYGSVGLFVGPEGGWTPEELHEAQAAKCQPQTLGNQILRGETAAVIATYLAVHKRL